MTKAEKFDVAVVGAGAAGCVVAARLAERGSRSVILLEAGPDLRGRMPVQMRNRWEIVTGELDWGYASRPDEGIGVLPMRRNKVVGGTSWLTRFTPRGAPADYDAWAATGNQGWSWDDVLRTSFALSQISISAPTLGMAEADPCRRTATSICRMPT